MTNKEGRQLEQLEKKLDHFIESQIKRDEKIDSIHRALYGDAINQTSGLVEKQRLDDLERGENKERNTKIDTLLEGMILSVSKNTSFRKRATKALWLSGGGLGLGGVGTISFWEHLKTLVSKLL